MEENTKEWPAELLALFDDPLLDGVRPKPAAVTADDRIQRKMNELRVWIEQNKHEPDINSMSINEKRLAVSLQTLRKLGLWV